MGCLNVRIISIIHSCDIDRIFIVIRIVTVNVFDSVAEAIKEFKVRIRVVDISKCMYVVDDVGWRNEGCPSAAIDASPRPQVEEPILAPDIAGGSKADSGSAMAFLGDEGYWALMGLGICTKFELAVIVEVKGCSCHDGVGGQIIGDAASHW